MQGGWGGVVDRQVWARRGVRGECTTETQALLKRSVHAWRWKLDCCVEQFPGRAEELNSEKLVEKFEEINLVCRDAGTGFATLLNWIKIHDEIAKALIQFNIFNWRSNFNNTNENTRLENANWTPESNQILYWISWKGKKRVEWHHH